jgi:hypothetical protein
MTTFVEQMRIPFGSGLHVRIGRGISKLFGGANVSRI